MLMTPEQNIKKHINSPNLMIPNKVSKPLSWYNNAKEPGTLDFYNGVTGDQYFEAVGRLYMGDSLSPEKE